MNDFIPYEIIEGDYDKGMVLLADHAMNLLPAHYGNLGLPQTAFHRHIAFDIGIEGLTRSLATRLGVPAVLGRFSRLLIDPNRGEDDPTLIMKISDGAIIPGNHPISDEEWQIVFDVNVGAAMGLSRAVAPGMKKAGASRNTPRTGSTAAAVVQTCPPRLLPTSTSGPAGECAAATSFATRSAGLARP